MDERGLGRVPDLTKTPSFFHSSAGIAPFAVLSAERLEQANAHMAIVISLKENI